MGVERMMGRTVDCMEVSVGGCVAVNAVDCGADCGAVNAADCEADYVEERCRVSVGD